MSQRVDEDYETLLGRFDAPMAIVTLSHRGERSGCLVGFHSSCSIDPPLHAVWLSQANHTHGPALASELLAVHLVEGDRHDLAAHFGGSTGDEIDKFSGVRWHEGHGGVPLLDDLENRFVGRRVRTLDTGGDHTCVVLAPVTVDLAEPSEVGPLGLSGATDIDPGHTADDERGSSDPPHD